MSQVNARRGGSRREQARATRRRIVDRAYELFSEHGYTATTMEMIADAADVAVQTVHYVFRTKAALLREVVEVAGAGQHDPTPVEERSWMREALAADDGNRTLALVVEHGVDLFARVAPLGAALQTATTVEPDIAEYWRSITEGRRGGMGQLVAALDDSGQLREGLESEPAADLLFVLHSHETFLGLTRDCDWPIDRYKAWLYRTLCHQLLADPGDGDAATEDLSFHGLIDR